MNKPVCLVCGAELAPGSADQTCPRCLLELALEDPSESADQIVESNSPPRDLPERIGPYRIIELLGQGGMGQVYLAEDTSLERQVALKFLPQEMQADETARKRFQREAKSAAALDHPFICHIHEIGEAQGKGYIAMEYVQGVTLKDKIAEGPLPLKEALQTAPEIAEAIEEAHNHNIVHRDLKPSNIMITPGGHVKVMDFGLAKRVVSDRAGTEEVQLTSLTKEGTMLGTVPYMSPEQIKGEEVDTRSDIFSFGIILYQILAGVHPFIKPDSRATASSILQDDPAPVGLHRAGISPVIQYVVRKMLAKEPEKRYQWVREIHTDLVALQQDTGAAAVLPGQIQMPQPGKSQSLLHWAVSGLLAVTIVAIVLIWNSGRHSQDQTAIDVVRSTIALPETHWLSGGWVSREQSETVGFQRPSRRSICFSPDGKLLVYSAITGDKAPQLYLRPTDQLQATPIPGTEGGSMPFFSPDGQSIGFWADGKLKKVSLNGGLPVDICDAQAWPVSWGSNGMIVFNKPGDFRLWQVSDSGGDPQPLTQLEDGETRHSSPEVLPGGKALLYAVRNSQHKHSHTDIAVQSLETGERRTLVKVGSDPQYVPSGHVIFARDGDLLAAPFDLDRLTRTGNPVPVVENVMQAWYASSGSLSSGATQVAFSQTGTLAYVSGNAYPELTKSLVFVDRKGVVEPVAGSPKTSFSTPRIAPNGLQIAYGTIYRERFAWIFDTSRGVTTQLTFEGDAGGIIWTPEGERVAFGSRAVEEPGIYWMPVDRSASMERLPTGEIIPGLGPRSWSPDGKLLAFSVTDQGQNDIWILDMQKQKVTQFTDTPHDEDHADFSRDGRYLAYSSMETGRQNVYVQAYPGPGERATISTDRGSSPSWSPDGRQLFYVTGSAPETKMMAVDIKTSPRFSAGEPKFLFEGDFVGNSNHRNYDITPDGEKFLMVQRLDPPRQPARQIIIVQNWFEELKRLVPTDN